MTYLILINLIFILSCSSAGNPAEPLEVISANKIIVLENNLDEELFYFLVEETCRPLIDWIPSLDGPKIEPGKSMVISYDSVYHCSDERPVKENDEVVIYFWTRTYTETYTLRNITVKLM